jgi:hypothetical protein
MTNMEYIDNFDFEQVSNFLTHYELGPHVLNGKIEAFTTSTRPMSTIHEKSPHPQKKPQSYLKTGIIDIVDVPPVLVAPLVPSLGSIKEESVSNGGERLRSNSCSSTTIRRTGRRRASSLGNLSDMSTQMLLLDLTTTLNESFPDYDFGNSKLDQFKNKEPKEVISTVNGLSYFTSTTCRL